MMGMPIGALATTEMSTIIEDGVHGYLNTNPDRLIEGMQNLLENHGLAQRMGEDARKQARQRFRIERFVSDWDRLLKEVAG